MNHQLLTERISTTIATGSLPPQLSHGYSAIDFTIGDLLRPWGELYPGVPETLADSNSTAIFGYGSKLRHPHIKPTPRRSPRPLPLPHHIPGSPKLLKKGLLNSCAAVWDFYQHRGLVDEQILQHEITEDSLNEFLSELHLLASDYSPMEMELENISFKHITDLDGFNLFIPCETYEDESAGVVQAFLEGAGGVRWLLENYFESSENGDDLPKQDHKLIAEQGFEVILKAYADYTGPKMADLNKLENFADTYFGAIQTDYPDHWSNNYDIISGDGGNNNFLTITSRQDIEFALAYGEAFYRMIGDIPTPWQFTENTDGIFDTFIHEICNSWRQANGKRILKWISPQSQTLAARFRTGDL